MPLAAQDGRKSLESQQVSIFVHPFLPLFTGLLRIGWESVEEVGKLRNVAADAIASMLHELAAPNLVST